MAKIVWRRWTFSWAWSSELQENLRKAEKMGMEGYLQTWRQVDELKQPREFNVHFYKLQRLISQVRLNLVSRETDEPTETIQVNGKLQHRQIRKPKIVCREESRILESLDV